VGYFPVRSEILSELHNATRSSSHGYNI